MLCQKCGKQNVDNASFCWNCGNSFVTQEVPSKNDIPSIQQQQFPNNEKKENSLKKSNGMKKLLLFIIGIFIIVFIGILVFWVIKDKSTTNYGSVSSKEEISYSYSGGNVPKFIDGTFSSKTVSSSDDVLQALEDIKDVMKFENILEELELSKEEKSKGITYYKYNQVYKGVPVYNQNIIISVDKNGKILGLSGYYIPDIDIDIIPKKTKEDVEKNLTEILGENATIISNDLYVWAGYESQNLIYVVTGYSDEMVSLFLVDANSGEILSQEDAFDYATTYSYTGMGLDSKTYTINLEEYMDLLNGEGQRYRFYDPIRNISIADYRYVGGIASAFVSAIPGTTPITVDIVSGNIDLALQDEKFIQSAITAMAHYEKIYDYYRNVLDRDSFDNKGSKIIVNLGVTDSTFSSDDLNNAFWFSPTNQMFIGNWNGKSFAASLDVLGHEFTHGVVAYTAELAHTAKEEDKMRAFETGALNEGYADILGSLIEGKNWTIAETNEIIRDISNPLSYKQPCIKGGKYYYPDSYFKEGETLEQFLENHSLTYITDYDKGGVHTNSGVVSYAAYLMYKSGAFSSREEMAKVWYNSLFLLSSYSNFEDCALAVIKSAKNLGLSEPSIYKITKAFQDTKMLESTDYVLKGTVSSGEEKIQNATIEIYSFDEKKLLTTVKSNEQGEYSIDLPTGTYEIKVSLENFEPFSATLFIKGETTLDIKLASKLANKDEDSVNFTMYFLESDGQELGVIFETIAIKKGTIIDPNIIVDAVNSVFKSNVMQTDGKSFYMTYAGIQSECAWYYKDTDIKFDWNEPIVKDTEIEMKLFDDLVDDEMIKDLVDFFTNKNNLK